MYRSLPGRARARFSGGRFSEVKGGTAVFVVPNDVHAARCREVKNEVETALAAHFGVAVPLTLAVEEAGRYGQGTDGRPSPAAGTGAPERTVAPPEPEEEHEDPFAEAGAFGDDPPPAPVASPADRLKQAFPGAEEVAQ